MVPVQLFLYLLNKLQITPYNLHSLQLVHKLDINYTFLDLLQE